MRLPERIKNTLPLHARESGIVFGGDVLSKSLTFLITVLLLRLVRPEEYALYGVFITVLATVQQFTDSGLHASLIRFTAQYLHMDAARAAGHLRFAWRVKWVALVFTGILLLAGSELLSRWVFFTPALGHPLRIIGAGLLGFGFFDFLLAVLQARQQFKALTILRVTEGFGKLAVIGAFAWAGAFSLDAVYYTYLGAPALTS